MIDADEKIDYVEDKLLGLHTLVVEQMETLLHVLDEMIKLKLIIVDIKRGLRK
jgi:hypothetical protein